MDSPDLLIWVSPVTIQQELRRLADYCRDRDLSALLLLALLLVPNAGCSWLRAASRILFQSV